MRSGVFQCLSVGICLHCSQKVVHTFQCLCFCRAKRLSACFVPQGSGAECHQLLRSIQDSRILCAKCRGRQRDLLVDTLQWFSFAQPAVDFLKDIPGQSLEQPGSPHIGNIPYIPFLDIGGFHSFSHGTKGGIFSIVLLRSRWSMKIYPETCAGGFCHHRQRFAGVLTSPRSRQPSGRLSQFLCRRSSREWHS